jgi:hypothetical protein
MQAITEYYAFIRYGKLQIFLSTAVVNIPRMTVIHIFILRSVVVHLFLLELDSFVVFLSWGK